MKGKVEKTAYGIFLLKERSKIVLESANSEKLVISSGIPRSGSTLMYQVLQYMMPEKIIIKTHDFIQSPCRVVLTYRDFRDVLVSLWRAQNSIDKRPVLVSYTNKMMTKRDIDRCAKKVHRFIKIMDMYKTVPLVLWMKYELFYDNFDFLVSTVSSFLNMPVQKKVRQIIFTNCSIKKNKETASKFADFHQYDPDTHIHGDHIYDGKANGWKRFIPEKYQEYTTQIFKEELCRYGYKV